MLPKGTIWQHLRSDALDAIPVGSIVHKGRLLPLSEWRTRGSFTVSSVGAKNFTLEGQAKEIGQALLSDAELLLDHAAEQRAVLFHAATCNKWSSSAWLVVSAYYWSFFSANAFSRLVGQATWFLDKEDVNDLHALCAGATPTVGAGTFRLTVGPMLSGTHRTVSLLRRNDRLHEAMWKEFFRYLGVVHQSSADPKSNPDEARLFAALASSASRFTPDWPSALRNAVNYTPGCGYGAVRGEDPTAAAKHLRAMYPQTTTDVIDRFEIDSGAHRSLEQLISDLPLATRQLISFASLVSALALELHDELIDRNTLDHRWRTARNSFFLKTGVGAVPADAWPYRT